MIPVSILAGSLTTLSPCVLPALPLIVGGAFQEHRHGPIALSAGMTLAFTISGVAIGGFGNLFGVSPDTIRIFAAILMVMSGAFIFSTSLTLRLSEMNSGLASNLGMWMQNHLPSGLKGQFLTGSLMGLVWSPCTGPTLGAAAGMAAGNANLSAAVLIFFLFGVGANLPLLLIAYGARSFFSRHEGRIIRFGKLAKQFFGGILAVIGLFILMGWDHQAESMILNWMPDWWLDLTTKY